MEPTHKKSDCYFFFYSTCIKGDNCAFRHEPSALGCEIMCSYWQQGNCLNEHCNFRHMELKKNRKSIQCFWETQRSGCKKPHCPFMHLGARPAPNTAATNPIKTAEVTSKPVTQEWSNRPDDSKFDGSGTESDQGRGSSEAGSFIGSPAVDPLIVNFDEESDNESVPSPVKRRPARVPYCKTYEEIRLEEIQAESAAYYSYEPDDYVGTFRGGKHRRALSLHCGRRTSSPYSRQRSNAVRLTRTKINRTSNSPPSDFKVLSLDEIRLRKAAQPDATKSSGDSSDKASSDKASSEKASSDKASSEKASGEKASSEKPLSEKASSEKASSEKASSEKASSEKASGEKASGEKASSEKALNEKASGEKASSEKPLSENTSRVEQEQKDAPAQTSDKKPGEFLRDAIKTLAELKAETVTKTTARVSRKRSIETAELNQNSDDSEGCKISKTSSKVPPVRLRRSPKRLSRSEMNDEATNTQTTENYTETSDDSLKPRAAKIEVRVCDSSTMDEPQSQIAPEKLATVPRGKGDKRVAHATSEDVKLDHLGDTILSNNDDEYLTISDPASDDILKDIDALLTEKTTV